MTTKKNNDKRYFYQMDDYKEICEVIKKFMDSGLWEGDKVEFLNRFMHGYVTVETMLTLAK